MWDIIREALLGQCLRLATGQKAARYPEEQPGFGLPARYLDLDPIVAVGWYGPDPSDNPYHWSVGKNFALSIGSSLYTAGNTQFIKSYSISSVVASLGLFMYIFAYSISPLLWAPLSEFLIEFFSSPCLATAGSRYTDVYIAEAMPYIIALWGGGGTLAPSPWELLSLSSLIIIFMPLAMPETSSNSILHRQAQGLPALSGHADLKPKSRIIYGFSTGKQGLTFLSYFYFLAPRHLGKYNVIPPEAQLRPGLLATWLIPIGLFVFNAFTYTQDINLLGITISMYSILIITQAIFMYLPFTYPHYTALLFAANALAISLLASLAISFTTPIFKGIGISGGVTLLASFEFALERSMFTRI
ncbi:uncharacterized protein BDV14DRAFT_193958 [Aspergillus stella-maris]|uniref:uncharacterized protein n=1 Tax=Aspergillus stella-maris TaxID=1810926 RepID=UPI003CCDBD77